MPASTATSRKLVDVAALGDSGVTVIADPGHGDLAVGVVDGVPFAVSNRCRHLFASLGKGRVADGCLECPWHQARFDVRTGKMTRGPQGAFKPIAGAVKGTMGRRSLEVYPVELRGEEIWLVS